MLLKRHENKYVRWLFPLLFLSFPLLSQTLLQGYVRDLKTKEALPFCAVAVKNSLKGCLSNEEGLFQIYADALSDTFLISYIGYTPKELAVSEFVKNPVIYLQGKENRLSEVVVYSDDSYLYALVEKCRKNMLAGKVEQSKAYFVLETELSGQPVELLECYYNSRWNASVIKNLQFKNGRVGIATYEGRYFMSQDISKAFTFINLTQPNGRIPAIPFQYSLRKLKKYFRLQLMTTTDPENPLCQISFSPVDTSGGYFYGEAWIEKESGQLKKITLHVNNTPRHPFLPLNKEMGEIKSVSMHISKTYGGMGKENYLSHMDFNYQLVYTHLHNSSFINSNPDTNLLVTSKGLVYFYDYANPFILPYFRYDEDLSDYRKISSLTYNDKFWNAGSGLVYSEKMKKGILYFKNNGQLLNYKSHQAGTRRKKTDWVYETNYLQWTPVKRIFLKTSGIKRDTVMAANDPSQTFIANRYKLKAQIFLDLNKAGDSIEHYSASIFDVYETFYHLPEDSMTNCFINIYFDLCEIERRNMERIISANKFSEAQFDSVYTISVNRLETTAQKYFKEVQRGTHIKNLKKWNDLVKDSLGVDNFSLFQIRWE